MNQAQQKKLKKAYPIIEKISNLTHISTVELIMTVMDFKPALAEMVIYDAKAKKNFNQVRKYAHQLGLHLAISKHKYIVNSPQGIFKEIPIKDPRKGKIIIALSKSKDKAEKGAGYYHAKMIDGAYSYKFGKLMGYPECCLKFGDYLKNDNNDPNNFGFANPAIESLKRSKYLDWRLNVFTNSLLSHFPCSLTCQKSIDYIDKYIDCLKYVDKEKSKHFTDLLTKPASLYWTCADQILIYGDFKPYTLGTGEIKYHKIEPKLTSASYYQENDKQKLTLWKKIEKQLKKETG